MAAKKLHVDIHDCIVFEDTTSGIQSGSSAGACCIGIASELSIEKLVSLDGCSFAVNNYENLSVEKLNDILEQFHQKKSIH